MVPILERERIAVAGVNGRRRVLRAAAAAVILAVSACSTVGPTVSAAADVAVQFHQALTAGDGTTACSVLAPETVHELEQTNGSQCDQAVLDQDLPDAQTVQVSQVFGHGAQVLMDRDVLFLAVFDGRWEITAAGCRSRGDRPYDCDVKGS